MYIYLDHNIYISALNDSTLKSFLTSVDDQKAIFLYSPAHIEEIFKVLANDKSQHQAKMPDLLDLIEKVTKRRELLPTKSKIVIKSESPQKCLERVADYDTREIIKHNGKIIYKADSNKYKKLCQTDITFDLNSCNYCDIWETPKIKEIIDEHNKAITHIIKSYNNSNEVQLLLLLGIDKRIPNSFYIEKDIYSQIKNNFSVLEYTIEILFRILNNNGYHIEENKKTTISSIHDVTHAIYATKADYIITMDKNFYNKCNAVYHFLGVPTRPILTKSDSQYVIQSISELITGQ